MGSYLHLMREGHLIFYAKTGVGHVLFSKNMRVGYIKLVFIKMIFFQPSPNPCTLNESPWLASNKDFTKINNFFIPT